MLGSSDYRMHGCVCCTEQESSPFLPSLWGQVLFKEVSVASRHLAPSAAPLFFGSSPHILRGGKQVVRAGAGRGGRCLRAGTLGVPGCPPAGASPVTVRPKTCRSPNRQGRAAVYRGASAAAAAARCCLCRTARASVAGLAATTRTRGSTCPGPPTRRSCSGSGSSGWPLRSRTWRTS